jgi:hypothetical protein
VLAAEQVRDDLVERQTHEVDEHRYDEAVEVDGPAGIERAEGKERAHGQVEETKGAGEPGAPTVYEEAYPAAEDGDPVPPRRDS